MAGLQGIGPATSGELVDKSVGSNAVSVADERLRGGNCCGNVALALRWKLCTAKLTIADGVSLLLPEEFGGVGELAFFDQSLLNEVLRNLGKIPGDRGVGEGSRSPGNKLRLSRLLERFWSTDSTLATEIASSGESKNVEMS